MKLRTILTTAILMILLSSCSSEQDLSVKPEKDSISPTIDKHADSIRALLKSPEEGTSYPLAESLSRLDNIRGNSTVFITLNLIYYWQAEGSFPDSLDTFIESGFAMFWPPNVETGEPLQWIDDIEAKFNEDDPMFGYISYEKLSDDSCVIKHVTLDREKTVAPDQHKWKIKEMILPHTRENYRSSISIEETSERDRKYQGVLRAVSSVDDSNTRALLARACSVSSYIISQTSRFHNTKQALPASVDDLQIFSPLIIKENFDDFIKSLNVDGNYLICGNDHEVRKSYVELKLDHETFMKYCLDWQLGGVPISPCDFAEIDTSSPIIDARTLSELSISDKHVISVDDLLE